MSTVRLEAIAPTGAVNIPLQPASHDIWDKKYRLKSKQGEPIDRNIDETYQRVAHALSEAESTPDKRKYWYERFLWALRRGAIPAGRITSNAGALEHKPCHLHDQLHRVRHHPGLDGRHSGARCMKPG
jgi:ribonucleoside-diphosphate reductase alpha chain